MSTRSAVLLAIAACLAHGWGIARAPSTKLAPFVVVGPGPASVREGPAYFWMEWVAAGTIVGPVHGPSLCQLADGSLLAAWQEGAAGTSRAGIYTARRGAGKDAPWGDGRRIVSAGSALRETRRHAAAVGDPVLYAGGDKRVWLLFSSTGPAGSSINLQTSSDGARTWGPARRLRLSPLLNADLRCSNRPVGLLQGGFVVPLEQALCGPVPQLLWVHTGDDGEAVTVRMERLPGNGFTQPALVALLGQTAVALWRDTTDRRRLGRARTDDGGSTWSGAAPIGVANSSSRIDALMLSDGRLLLVHNGNPQTLQNLHLSLSTDAGESWAPVAVLEDEEGERYSDPCLLQDREGRIHLLYVFNERRIRHVMLNEAWIQDKLLEAGS